MAIITYKYWINHRKELFNEISNVLKCETLKLIYVSDGIDYGHSLGWVQFIKVEFNNKYNFTYYPFFVFEIFDIREKVLNIEKKLIMDKKELCLITVAPFILLEKFHPCTCGKYPPFS
jgi:hypothetical protein